MIWPFDHNFSSYTWPGPFGWVARETPGNLAASAIAFTAGWALKGRRVVAGLHDRLDVHKDHLARILDRLEDK